MQKDTRFSHIQYIIVIALLSLAPFLLVGLFDSHLYQVIDTSPYLVFHNVTEFFSVMVSLSIFGLGWNAYNLNKDNHSLYLSVAFLAIGLMDFMHTLGYTGMPSFITINTPNKPTLFWIAVRLFSAAAFLSSAFIYPGKNYRWLNKTVLLLASVTISFVVFAAVIFFPDQLPTVYLQGVGLTPFKVAAEYVIIVLFLLAAVAYRRRFKASNDPLIMYYQTAFILCICSELAFTLYKSAFDTYNMLGHIYKVIAFLLMYQGIFVASVRRPYKELQQSRNMLNHIMDSVPQSVFWKDRECNYLGCNRIFASQAGLDDPADIIGKNDFNLPWGAEASTAFRADDREVMENGIAKYDIIERLNKADGTEIWIDTTKVPLTGTMGGVEGVLGVYEDITKRKQAEEDLKTSLLFNQQIISCASEGVIVYDNNLNIRVWNPFMEELSGFSAADVIGRKTLEVFPFHAKTGLLERLEQVLKGGSTAGGEYQYQIPETGKPGWAWDHCAPLLNINGDIIGVIRTVRDITESRKIEEQLRQSQKMEALGQLAGGVAHDFNNMLQVIIGYASLLENSASSAQKVQIHEIIKASDRAAELTSGLLSYSRKQVFKLEPLDIRQLIGNVEKFLHRILGEDIELDLKPFSEPLVAIVDKSHIQQVFVNLASNARDAMPSGGTLSINMERMEMDDEFVHAHGFGTIGPHALISISDTGEGISQEHLQHIFEPFFTTKAEGKGTGLGLAIVYGIIAQHHGAITCYSDQGRGTTFHVYLPLAGEIMQSAGKTLNEPLHITSGTTILLVEDDPAVRKVTRCMLELHGYSVMEAQHGKEAVELFSQHFQDINLVILDALMPEMNGAETLLCLQELVPDVKAMFMSGYAQDIISGKMILPGNIEFVNKPVIPARLIEAIRKTMAKGTGTDSF